MAAGWREDYDPETYQDSASARQTMQFLESVGEDPFFALIDIGEPHPPYKEWPGILDDLALDEVTLPPYPELEESHPVVQAWRKSHGVEALTEMDRKRLLRAYWSQAMFADRLVGRLLDKLDELGLAQNTLVVWGSDHGDFIGEFGCYEKWDNALYDCLTQVPLVMRLPRVLPPGERKAALVELIDVAPTILEICEMPVPEWMHGRSLLALAQGRTERHKEVVFSQGGVEPVAVRKPGQDYLKRLNPSYYGKQRTLIEHPEALIRAHMVRTETHKLIYRLTGDHELYDLVADPGELVNRYGDAALAELQMSLQLKLLEFFATYQQDQPAIRELWA
ncbi:MAG: sulfatase-like hydrolase/transferase [Blastochloris sp.]|nr:sulfatase-like hydrolase/transferase [Blastochloris sp.]